jgi:hypothetical protein
MRPQQTVSANGSKGAHKVAKLTFQMLVRCHHQQFL